MTIFFNSGILFWKLPRFSGPSLTYLQLAHNIVKKAKRSLQGRTGARHFRSTLFIYTGAEGKQAPFRSPWLCLEGLSVAGVNPNWAAGLQCFCIRCEPDVNRVLKKKTDVVPRSLSYRDNLDSPAFPCSVYLQSVIELVCENSAVLSTCVFLGGWDDWPTRLRPGEAGRQKDWAVSEFCSGYCSTLNPVGPAVVVAAVGWQHSSLQAGLRRYSVSTVSLHSDQQLNRHCTAPSSHIWWTTITPSSR